MAAGGFRCARRVVYSGCLTGVRRLFGDWRDLCVGLLDAFLDEQVGGFGGSLPEGIGEAGISPGADHSHDERAFGGVMAGEHALGPGAAEVGDFGGGAPLGDEEEASDEEEAAADALFRARMLSPADLERFLRHAAEVWELTLDQMSEVLEDVIRRHTH